MSNTTVTATSRNTLAEYTRLTACTIKAKGYERTENISTMHGILCENPFEASLGTLTGEVRAMRNGDITTSVIITLSRLPHSGITVISHGRKYMSVVMVIASNMIA